MPMDHIGGDFHNVAGFEHLGGLALLLVISDTADRNENLAARVAVPVVAAAGRERHVGDGNAEFPVLRQAREVRLPAEIFGVRYILFAERERAGILHSERAVSDDGEDFPNLRVAQSVALPDFYVGFQLAFNAVHCGEHCDGRDLAGAPVEIVPGEDVAEKVGFQKFVYRRRELKEGALNFPSC